MQAEYSPSFSQAPDNQDIGVPILGVEGDIYNKATPMQNTHKQIFTGIYAITNPLGQSYIGQAIDWEKRLSRYKRLACKRQPKIYRSLKWHGVDNHTFTFIEACGADMLDELEALYKMSYIEENGWENALFCRIDDRKRDGISTAVSVSQYTKTGEWVADFASLAEAERATGIFYTSIGAVVDGRRKTAGGFLWAPQGADAPVFKRRTQYRTISVSAYNADNQLVGTWGSCKEAAEENGISRGMLSSALNGKIKTAGGLKWKRINN